MAALVRTLALAIVAAVLTAGCNLLPEVKDETAGWSAERLYRSAHDSMLEGNYTRAVKLFETLESRFPYGRYAQQALLEGAYANYRANEVPAAISQLDRFIRTYPNHPNVDYAYYLKGLANFNEDLGLLAGLSRQDLSERAPKGAREAFDSFRELVERFPESRYADDSRARMQYLINSLASHEVHVSRYYYNRGAYVAAINRAQTAVNNFPQAPAIEEALFLMVMSYDKLGMAQLRDDADRVMRKNFPDSVYFRGGPEDTRPWWQLW